MARLTANASGNFSSSTIWETTGLESVSIDAAVDTSITTAGVNTLNFTAPNTTNAATGVWVYAGTYPSSGRNWTAQLQESTVSVGVVATINQTDMPVTAGWIYFRLGTPYVFTTTGANAYRWIIKSTTANSGAIARDSVTTARLVAMTTYDLTQAPTLADQCWIGPHNCTTAITVTVDGVAGDIRGTAESGVARATTLGLWIGGSLTSSSAILKWDTSATASLSVGGDIIVSDGGELQMGTVASPYPSSFIATLTRRNANATVDKCTVFGTGKIIMQGASKTFYDTTFVSGTGVAASPLVVADAVDWTVGDRIAVCASSSNATNYNETELKFIITKNSTTSYVLSDSSGGAEAAFLYTHTNAKIVNLTRNVVYTASINNTNHLQTNSSSSSAFKVKWVYFGFMGTTSGTNTSLGSTGGLRVLATSIAAIDYCVFDKTVNYGLINFSTTAQTYIGNIYVASGSGGTSTSCGLAVLGVGHTFTGSYFIGNRRGGIEYDGINCTFTNPTIISCNTDGIAAEGGIYLTNGAPVTITGANIHCNRIAGIVANTTTNSTFTNCNIGSIGANTADIHIVTNSANRVLFSNCNLGSSTTAVNYLNGAIGATLITIDKFNQTENNHRWYTEYGSARSTGATLGDTTVRTSGTLNVRMDSESSSPGFYWEYKVLATPGKAVPALGFIQKNTAFGTDVCLVELFLPGSTVADASQTMGNTTGSYLVYNLAATYTGTVSRYAKVRITAKTTTASAYIYVADIINGTNHITDLTTWDTGQPSPIMFEQLGDSAAVWAVLTSTLTTSGTTGYLLTKLLTVAKFLALK